MWKACGLIFLSWFILSACTGTGGGIGGLLPAPKFLKGEVKGGYYVAPEQAFSVRLPYSPEGSNNDAYEWRYAKVHEIQDKGKVEGVVFGPHAFDRNLYHVVLIYKAIEGDPKEYVQYVTDQKLKNRKQKALKRHFEVFPSGGKDVYYFVYEGEYSYMVLSFIDFEDRYVVVDVDVEKRDGDEERRPSLDKLKKRGWDKYNFILESLKVPANPALLD